MELEIEKKVMKLKKRNAGTRPKHDEITNLDVSKEVEEGVYEGEVVVIKNNGAKVAQSIRNFVSRFAKKTGRVITVTTSEDKSEIYVQRIK